MEGGFILARKFEPLGDGVLIKPIEQEEVTASGLVLPDTAKEKPQEGKIISVGPGRLSEDGKRVAMEVKKGDKVLFRKYSGTEVKDGEEELLIVRESDIVAKIR
jgi:chaperonin GroES